MVAEESGGAKVVGNNTHSSIIPSSRPVIISSNIVSSQRQSSRAESLDWESSHRWWDSADINYIYLAPHIIYQHIHTRPHIMDYETWTQGIEHLMMYWEMDIVECGHWRLDILYVLRAGSFVSLVTR